MFSKVKRVLDILLVFVLVFTFSVTTVSAAKYDMSDEYIYKIGSTYYLRGYTAPSEYSNFYVGDKLRYSAKPLVNRQYYHTVSVSSSDNSVASVEKRNGLDGGYEVTFMSAGTATLTATGTYHLLDNGGTDIVNTWSFTVNVTDMVANVPEMMKQLDNGIKAGTPPTAYYDRIEAAFRLVGSGGDGAYSYELWRSTSKDGSYKLIATLLPSHATLNSDVAMDRTMGGQVIDGDIQIIM